MESITHLQAKAAYQTASIAARVERVPLCRFHRRFITLISLGGWFDFYDIFMMAYIGAALQHSQFLTLQEFSHMIAAGFADFSLISFHFKKVANVNDTEIALFYAGAMAAGAAAQLHGGLVERELVGPRREPAVASELLQLGQDCQQRVLGGVFCQLLPGIRCQVADIGREPVKGKQRGVQHIDEIRVDLNPGERDTMMTITGRRTVPQIWIGDTHVGGYDDLVALDRAGGLKPLLEAQA